MKQGIHPEYKTTTIVCACGNRFDTKSTQDGEIHVEICSVCHPFYTGKQRLVDTAGRVERFKRKYGDTSSGEAAGAEQAEGAEAKGAGKGTAAKKGGKKQKAAAAAGKGAVTGEAAPEGAGAEGSADEASGTDE